MGSLKGEDSELQQRQYFLWWRHERHQKACSLSTTVCIAWTLLYCRDIFSKFYAVVFCVVYINWNFAAGFNRCDPIGLILVVAFKFKLCFVLLDIVYEPSGFSRRFIWNCKRRFGLRAPNLVRRSRQLQQLCSKLKKSILRHQKDLSLYPAAIFSWTRFALR